MASVVRDVLHRLVAVDGVEAALVATSDGLLIDGAGQAEDDLEGVAAIGTYAVQATGRLSELGEHGPLRRVTIEGGRKLVVLDCLAGDAVLILLLNSRMNLGYARFLLDRYRDTLLDFVSATSA